MPPFLVIVLNMPAMLNFLTSPISDKSCEHFCLLPEVLFYTHKQIALYNEANLQIVCVFHFVFLSLRSYLTLSSENLFFLFLRKWNWISSQKQVGSCVRHKDWWAEYF